MGTTLTALQAGSGAFNYTVAIEGYKFLLTDAATAAAATTAWSGSDWSSALTGLFVQLQNHCEISPWDPFPSGGRCTLYVQPDATDQFGIDVHKRAAGAETSLAATADRDDTTITVLSTTGFAAATSEAFLGNECFEYSALTGTTFTASKRGKYCPFGTAASSTRFPGHHRQGLDVNQVQLDPVVSQQRRTWIGAWVGVWMHRNVAGVLDVQAQAQLVYAGRIVEIRDDAPTGCTVIELQHALDVLKDVTVGRTLMSGSLVDGVYLASGNTTFRFADCDTTGTTKTANNLTLAAGYYTAQQLMSAINAWLGGEVAASRIYGTYTLKGDTTAGVTRMQIQWRIPKTSSAFQPFFSFELPAIAGLALGFRDDNPGPNSGFNMFLLEQGPGDSNNVFTGQASPMNLVLFKGPWNVFTADQSIQVTQSAGTFIDNYALLPSALKPPTANGKSWGMFLVNNELLVRASYDGTAIADISAAQWVLVGDNAQPGALAGAYNKTVDDPTITTIRQVFIIDTSFELFFYQLLYSTGTSSFNHANYDVLPEGIGAALPGALLGSLFEASVNNANYGTATPFLVVIDKPTKIADLIGGDMVLHRVCLSWKQGTYRLMKFSTPTTTAALVTLDETTKALPAGQGDAAAQRSSSTTTTAWQKPLVKIAFNRDVTQIGKDGGYQNFITLEDGTVIGDQGGAGDPYTINARNSYSSEYEYGAGLDDVAPDFLATMPLFSRPARMIPRTIDQRYFEQIAPGDVVLVSDNFARDPVTGQRRITNVPALIVSLDYTPGGPVPVAGGGMSTQPQGGQVTLFFIDVNRVAAWSPCAQVDDTAVAGGFDHGYSSATSTLRCYAHQHTEASESADAAYFHNGDKLLIVEIDPTSTSSPTSWSRTVSTVSGNDITLTAALSSPAWDNTKRYRIIPDHYSVDGTNQQANTFQADADRLIEDLRAPFAYGTGGPPTSGFTAWAAGELAEWPVDVGAGDGKPLDTGIARGNIRLANALHDYKTARQAPMLWSGGTEIWTAGTGTYQALAILPIFLGLETYGSNVTRTLTVAPWLRSSDGTTTSLRVSLMQTAPIDSTWNDMSRGSIYAEQVWTVSSTTWATAAEKTFDIGSIKSSDGVCWLLVEGKNKAEFRGLAECWESARSPV